MFNKDKKFYKRLNDNAIMCIRKYKNRIGNTYHNLSLYYEDTDTVVEFGALLIKSKIFDEAEFEQYDFNNNYVVIWKYDEVNKKLDLANVYDVNKRENVMIDDAWANLFSYMDAEDNIRDYKLKTKRLGKEISIK